MLKYFLSVLALFLIALSGHSQHQKIYSNFKLSYIESALIYPMVDHPQAQLDFPITSLDQNVRLKLKFDDLSDQPKNYYYKLIHCNHDWTKSNYIDMDIVEQYNEFLIRNYEYSINTYTPYIHYYTQLPKVLKSGNYVVWVYLNNNPEEAVMCQRFMVYDNKVLTSLRPQFSKNVKKRLTHQQVDFSLTYGDFYLVNPMVRLQVVLRQNGRWENAKTDLKPVHFDETARKIDYTFFSGENEFAGLKEYRFFDTRSLQFRRGNVAQLTINKDQGYARLEPENPRYNLSYIRYPDINGQFVIDRIELTNGNTEADYLWVEFTLNTKFAMSDSIYIIGNFCNWKPNLRQPMKFNKEIGAYTQKLLLKQGYYNYNYATLQPNGTLDETVIEGSSSETENVYDLLIYYKGPNDLADQLIGYNRIDAFAN